MPKKKEPKNQEMTPQEQGLAVRLAWELGSLKYKLQPKQQEVYELIKAAPKRIPFVILCHRGFGKTFLEGVLANEDARQFEDGNVLIISSTLKKLRTIVRPAFQTILADCPEEYRPRFSTQDNAYIYPSGVTVHLCAAERGRIEDLRGIHKVRRVYIDEAAFFGDEEDAYPLDYVIDNILNPMFIRTDSEAQIIMLSTPPEIPGHPFQEFATNAKLNNCYAEYSIYNTDLSDDKVLEAKERCTSPDAWKREYECQWVFNTDRTVIPEFHPKEHVKDVVRPPEYKLLYKSLGMDLGVRDFTAGLFAYYDFKRAKIVVEKEFAIKEGEVRTDVIAATIKGGERDLGWFNTDPNLITRWTDNTNLLLINDLSMLHGMTIYATDKELKAEMVNKVRIFFQTNRIEISPECKMLIATLNCAFWDSKKKEFGRSKALGHMDLLDALIYLVRNMNTYSNPYPADYGYNQKDHIYPEGWDKQARSPEGRLLQQVFNKNRFINRNEPPKKQILGGL